MCVNCAFSNFVRLKLALVIQFLMVMSHRLEIRRALYLHYSNNKVGGDNSASTATSEAV